PRRDAPHPRLPACPTRRSSDLGRRGLYGSTGGDKAAADGAMAMLWVLNLADGTHTLLDIAERAGLPFARIAEAAMSSSVWVPSADRKSTRLNSSHVKIAYAVFC